MKAHNMEFTFHDKEDLLEEVCALPILRKAFQLVKRNKGISGVDGITIGMYELNLERELDELRQEVLGWTYKPTAVKRVKIPKPNGRGERLLGIPIVKDRVLHMALKIVLERIFEPTFSNSSYGFRPGKNQEQAVKAAQKIVQSGKEFVVDIDLSKFFDRIHHDRLIHRIGLEVKDKRVLRLIGMILRSGIQTEGVVTIPSEGSVQGSPLSPLLSNIVLTELDMELEKRGLEFCRYADDCNIFVRSEKSAERVKVSITKFIEKKLKLKVNEEKSQIAKPNQVKFLGMTIVKGTIAISKAAMNRAMEITKLLTPRKINHTLDQTMERLSTWFNGWSSYFKMTQYPSQIAKIEAHIRRRLRARIISQQKRRRYLYHRLVKERVSKELSYRTVYSNRGIWSLSHTNAVEYAFPVHWFKEKLGQRIYSNLRLPHWFPKGELCS